LKTLRISGDPGDVEAAMRAHRVSLGHLEKLGAYLMQVERELYDERTDKQLPPYELVTDKQYRRTAMFVERLGHWPMAMQSCTRDVPLGHPSWRVFVTSRRDGFIGRFRRCQDCKRWFQGRTHIHRMGHAVG